MSNLAFLLSWDNTGLEGVVEVDYTALSLEEQNRTASILSDPDNRDPGNPITTQLNNTLAGMKLRARYNPQRHYEIYLVPVASGVTEQDIRDLFNSAPQEAANLMRERGTKLYSDRADRQKVLIW